ncbi:Sec-independent protein translocase subunit TatA [Kitasatospora sp. NPDC059599]|uniref:Sec-independent protein translocase subunit TatA n=1 Tax=Kitasatospora sp. NPDC059599 TaxID=3346880 RepID=UPI0036920A5C
MSDREGPVREMLRNGPEPWDLLVVPAIVILLFGSKKLPDTARGPGRSMRILKTETAAMREGAQGTEEAAAPTAEASAAPAPQASQAKADGPARPDRTA